ncbi:MAG: hypothetical protein IJ364_01085, partial [Oscillospiraceae bacterium]|nr:hypothetical protein [Oscillospiraceae bacterium]
LSLFNTSFDAELSYGQKLAYCVSFDCGENSNIATIRCLIPDGLDDFKLYLGSESTGWRELEYSVDGSYAVVQPDDGDNKIAIVETMDYSLFLFAAAAVLIIVFASVLVFRLKKKRKSTV